MTTRDGTPAPGRGLAVVAVLLATSALVLAAVWVGGSGRATPPATASIDPQRPTTSPATPAETPGSTPADGAVTLIAAGDIGRCDSTADDATGALVENLPGVVATLGDTAYEDGTTQQLEQCFGGSWGRVKDRIRFAVTGNHDIHTNGGEPFQTYMGSAAVRDGHTWFSDTLGSWHVVVLDGNCGLLRDRCSSQSDQLRWLHEDLSSNSARCTLALIHQPRFSSGDHGNDRVVGPFWDELYTANAELALSGHDHDYERFAPQAPDGAPDDARGIVQIVAGTGGAALEAFKEPRPNSLVRMNDAHGVLELTLRADSWSSRFVDTAGEARDAASGTCH